MFETAELKRKIAKSEYNMKVPGLRTELLETQQMIRKAGFPVIVLFGGVDAAGKNETINLLNEWMDPRWIVTSAYEAPSDEERERPEYWRYWRDLPANGQVGLFLSAWYSRPVLQRVFDEISESKFDKELERITTFEKELADDGALILKFWMHLSREAQTHRFKTFEKDPLTSWRVTKTDWENVKRYDAFIAAAERAISRTSTGEAPWQIVEGYDMRYCGLTVATALRDAMRKHLAEISIRHKLAAEMKAQESVPSAVPVADDDDGPEAPKSEVSEIVDGVTILSRLNTDQVLTKSEYRTELAKQQARLHRLQRKAVQHGTSTVLVFEGWDAGGKGGAIRRITAALDARQFRVIPIAAPSDEELAHHYLWRFWRHVARAGRVTIYDRSWYGRVLVERVEGFAAPAEWQRAYGEINDFEDQLVQHGVVLCKYWLHITPEEQLRRFKEREQISYKRWKLTEEDWRNREKWGPYEEAVNDMVERTSTAHAPWTLVEGNDKRFARIKVLKTVCDTLNDALKQK